RTNPVAKIFLRGQAGRSALVGRQRTTANRREARGSHRMQPHVNLMKDSIRSRIHRLAVVASVLTLMTLPACGRQAEDPTPVQQAQTIGAWAPGVSYAIGALATFNGITYRCRQAHTSQVGWEPPNPPALWERAA